MQRCVNVLILIILVSYAHVTIINKLLLLLLLLYMWFQKDICKDNDNHFFSFSISDATNLNRLTCLIYRLDRRVSFTQMINRDQIKLYTKSYSSIIMSYRQFNTV